MVKSFFGVLMKAYRKELKLSAADTYGKVKDKFADTVSSAAETYGKVKGIVADKVSSASETYGKVKEKIADKVKLR